MKFRKYMRGITLVELMVVIIIIGIMAAVGYPNYRDFAARAKRTEAKSALLQINANQERLYLQRNSYTDDIKDLGFTTDPFITDTGLYSVTVTSGDASNFTARATYTGDEREKAKCEWFELDGRGSKTSHPYTNCWTDAR